MYTNNNNGALQSSGMSGGAGMMMSISGYGANGHPSSAA